MLRKWTKSFKILSQFSDAGISPLHNSFPSAEAHSHFNFYVCSHRLHVNTVLRIELKLHRGRGSLILVAQSFPLLQHSMTYLLKAMLSSGSSLSSSFRRIGNMSEGSQRVLPSRGLN